MSEHDFQVFENLMIFFSKHESDQVFSFSNLFFTFVKNFKPKKKKKANCVFECFQSHCHILKELHEFCLWWVAITIFGESGFIFNFVGYELVIKLLEVGCRFEKEKEKIKSVVPLLKRQGSKLSKIPSFVPLFSMLSYVSIWFTIVHHYLYQSQIWFK